MQSDLEITDPRPAAHWRAHNAAQIARLRPEAQPLFATLERDCWEREGLQVVLDPSHLIRTDAEVFELFKSGREVRGGQWVLVDPSKWRTNAVNALQTAHGERRRAGGDWLFLVDWRIVGPRAGVVDSWHASHSWARFGAAVERNRLKWGGRFPRPDLGHAEYPDWRSLPLLPA